MKKNTINFYLEGCSSDPKVIQEIKAKVKTARGEEKKSILADFEKQRSVFVYVRLSGSDKPIKCSTGWKTSQQYWEGENVAFKSDANLYNRISELYSWFEDITRPLSTEVVTKEVLENKIDAINGRPERNKSITNFLPWAENFIETSPKKIATRVDYRSTLNHLKNYAAKKSIALTWETFNLDFYNDFMEYLYSKGEGKKGKKPLVDSTCGKVIKNIKLFLRESFDQDKHTNQSFRKKAFKSLSSESDSIYLNQEEILKLYNLDLTDRPELVRSRDLFVFNCWIGVRYSDLCKIRPQHIEDVAGGKVIRITTTKTSESVVIPLHPIALEIFNKYDQSLPEIKYKELTYYNEDLRELGKLAKFNAVVQRRETIKGVAKIHWVAKWQMLSGHVGRKSFATNCYLIGIPSRTIMAVTGHRTEAVFAKYIKISKDEHAKIMMEHFNRAVMKVA